MVVVLIIGILAAIALPQYQLAVDKAEFAKYQAMGASLRDAYDEYILSKGDVPKSFNDLSFTLPSDFNIDYTFGMHYKCRSSANMFCCIYIYAPESSTINCGKKDLSIIYLETFFTSYLTNRNHKKMCLAEENNKRTNRLCDSLGIKGNIGNVMTPSGINNSYQKYNLN